MHSSPFKNCVNPTDSANTLSLPHILIRNTVWNFASQGWFLILVFLTTPYIVHKLGTSAYGVLSMVTVVIGYFGFLDLGLGQAVIKYVSEYYAKRDYDTIRKIISTALAVYFLMGSIGAAIIVSLTTVLVTRVLKIPSNLISVSSSVFYISAIGFLINMPLNVFGSIPKALQRFDIANKLGICLGSLQTFLTVLLLYLGFFLKEIVILNLLTSIASIAVYLIVSKRLLPQVQMKPAFSRDMFINLLRFGGFITLGKITVPIGTQMGRFFIGVFHPISLVSYYTIAYTLAAKLWIIPQNIVSAIFPTTSELFSQNQKTTLHELHLRSTKYIMIGVVPITALLIVFAEEILSLWMGADFAARSAFPLRLLALATLVSSSAWTSVTAAKGAGRPDIPAKVQVLQAAINVIFCLLLIPRWGINGAAVAWLIHHLIGIPLIIGITNREVVKMPNLEFIKGGLGIPLVVGGTIPCLLIPFRPFMSDLTVLISSFVFIGIVYAIVAYFAILDAKDRSSASDYLHHLLRTTFAVHGFKAWLNRSGD